jgi:hypothetical protein
MSKPPSPALSQDIFFGDTPKTELDTATNIAVPSSPALSQDIFFDKKFDEEFPKINDDLNNFFEIIDKIPQELKYKKIDKFYKFFDNSIENFQKLFITQSIKEPNSKIEENLAKIITAVKEINSKLEKIDAIVYDIDELKIDFSYLREEYVSLVYGKIGQERTREWLAHQVSTPSDTDKKGSPSISDSPRSSSSFDSQIGSSISIIEGVPATEPPTTPNRQKHLDDAKTYQAKRQLSFGNQQSLYQDTTPPDNLSAIPENSPRGDNFGRSTSNQSIAPDDITKKSQPDPENLIYDTRRNFYVLYKGSKDRVIFFDSIKDIADDFTKHFNSLKAQQRRELLGKKIKPWGDEKTLEDKKTSKISYEEAISTDNLRANLIQLEFHDKFNKKQVIEFKILAEQIQSYKTVEQLSSGAVEEKTKDFPVELTALPLNNSSTTQSFISWPVITQNQGYYGYNLSPQYYAGQNGCGLSSHQTYQPFSIYQQGYITPATTQSSLPTNSLTLQQQPQLSSVYTSVASPPQVISNGRVASYQSFHGNGNFVR